MQTENEARRSGARRSRKNVCFVPPIVGPSGAKLLSYDWQYMIAEVPNARGEVVEKRVSDWERSERNEHTGKNVVHQFSVSTPDGECHLASLETALKLLGFDDGSAGLNKVKCLASAAMQLAELRHSHEKLEADPQASSFKKLASLDRIERLEDRVKKLTAEAAIAASGVNPVQKYRDLHAKALLLRDWFNRRPNDKSQWQGDQIQEIAKAAAPGDRDGQQRIWEEGKKAHRALCLSAKLNILGERHHTLTPVTVAIPERVCFGSKIKAIPAWSDAKMRNWYFACGEDAAVAVVNAENWLRKNHPNFSIDS